MAGIVGFRNCWLRLKLDGAVGAREIVDNSKYNRKIYNGASSFSSLGFSTDQVKHLAASLKLSTLLNYSLGPSSPPLISANAFTIRFWIYPTNGANGQQKGIFSFANRAGDFLCRETSGNRLGIVYIRNNAQTTLTSTTTGLTNNAWNHIAICWDGSTLRLFKDGAVIASVAASASTSSMHICDNPTGLSRLGANSVDPNLTLGYYSDLEVYDDQAFYTGAFTPPTGAEVDYYRVINGDITESSAIVKWRVSAYDWLTGALVGTGYSSGTTYKVKVATTGLCYVTLTPVIDVFKAASSTLESKGIGATLAADDAYANPHLWVNNSSSFAFYINNAASSLTASSAYTDGADTVWDYLCPLVQPVTQGPLLPVDE